MTIGILALTIKIVEIARINALTTKTGISGTTIIAIQTIRLPTIDQLMAAKETD